MKKRGALMGLAICASIFVSCLTVQPARTSAATSTTTAAYTPSNLTIERQGDQTTVKVGKEDLVGAWNGIQRVGSLLFGTHEEYHPNDEGQLLLPFCNEDGSRFTKNAMLGDKYEAYKIHFVNLPADVTAELVVMFKHDRRGRSDPNRNYGIAAKDGDIVHVKGSRIYAADRTPNSMSEERLSGGAILFLPLSSCPTDCTSPAHK